MDPVTYGIEQIYSPIGARYLSVEAGVMPKEYLRQITSETLLLQDKIRRIAESITRTIFITEAYVRNVAVPFIDGEIIGIGLVRKFMPKNTHREIINNLAGSVVTSLFGGNHPAVIEQSKLRVEQADLGWSLLEPYYGGLLNVWDEDICPQAQHRPYLRRGFGLIVQSAHDLEPLPDTGFDEQLWEEFTNPDN